MRRLFLALAIALLPCMALTQTKETATAVVGTKFSFKVAAPTKLGYLVTINNVQTTSVAGLSYDNSTGLLSGTPTAAGTYSILLQQATAATGVYTTTQLALTVNAAGSTTTTPPPPPPATFCASSPNVNCGVNLSWNAPASPKDPVSGYLVFRATGSSSTYVQLTLAKIPSITYIDATIAPSTAYSYYVVSVDSAGAWSVPSNTVTVSIPAVAVIPPLVPDPPTGLVAAVMAMVRNLDTREIG